VMAWKHRVAVVALARSVPELFKEMRDVFSGREKEPQPSHRRAKPPLRQRFPEGISSPVQK
jgi:hypothetical protein